MNRPAKQYVWSVIGCGATALITSLVWLPPDLGLHWLLYLLGAAGASALKIRLPGNNGSYSLAFLPVLYGIARFNPSETLLVCCAGAAAQSLLNVRTRPKPVQVLFNMANVCLSAGLSWLVQKQLLATSLGSSPEAVSCVVACIYFAVNTVLVSEVLALLDGKRLSEINGKWYVWSFPCYLLGAAVVALATRGAGSGGEAWLVLVPLSYLIHFFFGLADGHSTAAAGTSGEAPGLPSAARAYIGGVLIAGAALMTLAVLTWAPADGTRFVAYLALAAMTSALKVRLPGMTGTISLNFLMLLIGISQLSIAEVIVMAATGGIVQSVWRPKRTPKIEQVLFNAATLSIGSAATWYFSRNVAAPWFGDSMVGLLVLSTLVLYGSNTLLVAVVLCLVDRKPLRMLWGNCHFWSFPYYVVGAALAGLIVAAGQSAGWISPLLMLSLMGLVFVSYRSHVAPVAR